MLRVSEPDIGNDEFQALTQAFQSTLISGHGPFVEKSEEMICQLTDSKFALTTCNGTASLHLALLALGVGPGDEVIVPSFTYIASINAILYVGAKPVFVDVDADSWTLDPEHVIEAISENTKAIMAVHLYGHPFDAKAILEIANEYGLLLVEDAAEGHVSEAWGRKAGTIGHISSFSFFGNKVLTCGEGGAVTTQDVDFFSSMRIIRNQGMDPNRRFFHDRLGNNFRLNNLSAAVLSAQLTRAPDLISRRNNIFALYDQEFADVEEFRTRPIAPWAKVTPWLYSVQLNAKHELFRPQLMEFLAQEGVETRPFFTPGHRLPYLENYAKKSDYFPNSDSVSKSGINLPTSSLMSDADVERVASLVKRFFALNLA